MKTCSSVYGSARGRFLARAAAIVALGAALVSPWPGPVAQAQPDPVVDAREAFRKKDRNRLAVSRAQAAASQHPLAMWADYWELSNRISEASQPEVEAFYQRWSGTYVEDRLRNDWLLELGHRRDWANFISDFPRFRMNDDREVQCYALLTQHQERQDVREAALYVWFAQRDVDEGCNLLAATLLDAKVFTPADVWRKTRLAVDAGRLRAARQSAALVSLSAASLLQEMTDSPARYLARKATADGRINAELATMALMRMASNEPDAAALALNERWERALPADLASWAWASVARQAAMKLLPDASDHYLRAARLAGRDGRGIDWPDDTMAWKARAALRADNGRGRWQQVVQAVDAMRPEEQQEATWVYWKARALQSLAGDSQSGEALRAQSRRMLGSISHQLSFYGALAAEALGRPFVLPPPPEPLAPEEKAAAAAHPGLLRALRLVGLGLRDEGRREWNYSLRGMTDRELIAAAALACEQRDWQLCINTSERTRHEIDVTQRYPTPYKEEIETRARELGLDANYVFGLIRQETRFMATLRSSAGASGLMQVMPATARWTARKIGLDFSPEMISDPSTNLRIGTGYLRMVLDAFDGSQALAAAAYNAGPNRPRRWREGPALDPAAWAENIPFNETRDYVKKVLANASIYAALSSGEPPALRSRLGRPVGPRDANAPEVDKDLP
ncbi:lytic transglycosylase domain-containing protein [Piscinibacter sp. XHJ-5]|uniref:lytic transglycosylase domain-containing protein n=1 Tax=Piscinibacter sp. XHJ-5 TaxID=3037797 RepID=UPI00245360F5|nr:lytic transglycosylase domain-containing protein [Piscinibacter sp. XHJ-5]